MPSEVVVTTSTNASKLENDLNPRKIASKQADLVHPHPENEQHHKRHPPQLPFALAEHNEKDFSPVQTPRPRPAAGLTS